MIIFILQNEKQSLEYQWSFEWDSPAAERESEGERAINREKHVEDGKRTWAQCLLYSTKNSLSIEITDYFFYLISNNL